VLCRVAVADPKFPAGPVALVALALCCALPALVPVGGGVVASALGLGLRFRGVTIVGAVVVAVGVIGVARRIRGHAWGASEQKGTDRER